MSAERGWIGEPQRERQRHDSQLLAEGQQDHRPRPRDGPDHRRRNAWLTTGMPWRNGLRAIAAKATTRTPRRLGRTRAMGVQV
jgi:hypothetical protein